MVEGSQFDDVPPRRLSDLLGGDVRALISWTPAEIEAIYRHQMATPLRIELGALEPADAQRLSSLADAQGLLLKSISDLLHHPRPPELLLRMLKDFAKRLMNHPDSALPREVTSVLYWSTIAAALASGTGRITSLPDDRLLEGFAWTANQPWVGEETARIVRDGAAVLMKSQHSAGGGSVA